MATQPSTTTDAPSPEAHRWRALAVCLVAGFMTLLDVSIVNVALPSVRDGLHMSEAGLQWVLSGYSLAFGLVLVPAGRLGDAIGRRPVFLAGLALFTATSALAGAARGESWLVVARLLQGMAGGLLVPQVSGFIQQLFRGEERARAFGLLGTTIGFSTAVGPLLGGLLIAAFGTAEGWRWVFYVNLPIGVAALPFAHRLLPAPTPATCARRDFDPVGVLLLGTGTVLLLLPLVQTQWHDARKWLLPACAALVLGAFVWWERRYARRREPLVHPGLFDTRSFTCGALVSLLYFAGFTAVFFVFTLYLQSGRHYTALQAGLAITPFALASAVASTVGGRLVTRYGRRLIAAGLTTVAVGLALAALAVHLFDGPEVGWATALPLLLAGLGSGLVVSPNQALTLQDVPVTRAGSAGGVLQTAQRIGSAAGIATVGATFFSHLGTPADYPAAFQLSLAVVLGFVLLALAAATRH
ncbi:MULTISPECIES: MFS transporter [Kitasatospora]|uniref:Putative drug resistance protein n=1 Tax=Kitasatospora setae (strain ATCC 33774 / DSM 43861 / JCM 3304 / KCC A-0304 / NBRC 14216 / KM-6054) TaxID=452652 RepID=E4NJ47_KITSK|nr:MULTISPECIES: MFS transporter [Kitasatospora]BAJ32995.1 putative drug resistance protein [Kitasatospora setae KM-6054]